MIIVTHEIRFAKNVSDCVVFVDKGAILEQGTPQEVIDRPQTARVQEFPQQDGAEITVTSYSTTLSGTKSRPFDGRLFTYSVFYKILIC